LRHSTLYLFVAEPPHFPDGLFITGTSGPPGDAQGELVGINSARNINVDIGYLLGILDPIEHAD
jgi:hypothetical protein